MRLVTLRTPEGTTAAIETADGYRELDGIPNVGSLLHHDDWRELASSASGALHVKDDADLAPVVPRPGKIVCAGLNYRAHILEMGRELPEHPTLFAKFPETLIGPADDIQLPEEDSAVDWEAELCVVIGRAGRRISEADAASHIAGYTVSNDVSMRSWQYRTLQWLQGKNWERTTPLGPALVTPDDWTPGAAIRTVIDGEVMQEGSTGDLVHSPEFLVSYISTFVTLNPGDVILTGTPGGVGHAREPKRYLTEGQLVEVTIDGLGTLRNRVVAG